MTPANGVGEQGEGLEGDDLLDALLDGDDDDDAFQSLAETAPPKQQAAAPVAQQTTTVLAPAAGQLAAGMVAVMEVNGCQLSGQSIREAR